MSLPLLVLGLGSIFVGYICKDMFIGVGSSFFNNSIFVLFNHVTLINAEFLPPFLKLIPVIGSLIGAFLSIFIYSKSRNFQFRNFYIFLSNK